MWTFQALQLPDTILYGAKGAAEYARILAGKSKLSLKGYPEKENAIGPRVAS
jgi:hypothetical protein